MSVALVAQPLRHDLGTSWVGVTFHDGGLGIGCWTRATAEVVDPATGRAAGDVARRAAEP